MEHLPYLELYLAAEVELPVHHTLSSFAAGLEALVIAVLDLPETLAASMSLLKPLRLREERWTSDSQACCYQAPSPSLPPLLFR